MQTIDLETQISAGLHSQIANMLAIQNLQQYLKYLILTSSIERQNTMAPEKMLNVGIEEVLQASVSNGIEPISFEEKNEFSTPISQRSYTMVVSENAAEKRQKSQKIFRFMRKRLGSDKRCPREVIKGDHHQKDEKNLRVVPLQKKITNRATACVHKKREHYARGVCSDCYKRGEKVRKPWNCSHDKLYAFGLCRECYIVSRKMKIDSFRSSIQSEAGSFSML